MGSSFFIGFVFTQVPAGKLAQRFGGKFLLAYSIGLCALLNLLTPLAARVGDCVRDSCSPRRTRCCPSGRPSRSGGNWELIATLVGWCFSLDLLYFFFLFWVSEGLMVSCPLSRCDCCCQSDKTCDLISSVIFRKLPVICAVCQHKSYQKVSRHQVLMGVARWAPSEVHWTLLRWGGKGSP